MPVDKVLVPKVWHLPLEDAEAVLTAIGIAYRGYRHQIAAVPEGELYLHRRDLSWAMGGNHSERLLQSAETPDGVIGAAPVPGSGQLPARVPLRRVASEVGTFPRHAVSVAVDVEQPGVVGRA